MLNILIKITVDGTKKIELTDISIAQRYGHNLRIC